ncbi:MAG: GAF domain-containing protein [Betaproteobacteria bacterium]|nr:GAF domain-containing protein [Betaproteobacteria bacterium]
MTVAKPATRASRAKNPAKASAYSVAMVGKTWQESLLRLLLSISEKVAALDSLDDILNLLVEVSTEQLGADRSTLFLNDPGTNELYSRVAQGNLSQEIRLMNDRGVAGWVYQKGEPAIIHDAYKDKRFDSSVDQRTGYTTHSILCVPIRNAKGELIGVAQALNKKDGKFSKEDQELLAAITTQGALGLESMALVERMKKIREQELEFLEVVSDLTSDIKIDSLLNKVMAEATRMLNAERSTLFLNDEKTQTLWSQVGQGLGSLQIRLPNTAGIAGAVFSSGKTINIPHAYADLRFNPAFDKKSGFFTRSILCVPIINQKGKVIGVTQVLNKKNGVFTLEDESRLKAFTAQIAISLENASLFADVQNMKNYNESMLESMSNGVITLDDEGRIVTCNTAGAKILRLRVEEIIGTKAEVLFNEANAWIMDKIRKLADDPTPDITMDAEMTVVGETVSVNSTILPLSNTEGEHLGSMFMFEDISSEKRMKSTMSRYVDPAIADQLLSKGGEAMGGQSVNATLLFSDIRGFTTLTEALGPQATVTLLNEYFEIMVDCITREGGMLDKFIGDAIMAAFGIPLAHDDDEDRAVRAAVAMISELQTWNTEREAEGKLPVNIGIGLNTDIVVSGNIGSKKRMDYTVIGDGVNLAARLESACKQYSAKILISEFTQAKLRGIYRMREVDLVVVKGKTQPVSIYEVLDYHTSASFPNMMDVLGNFTEGLSRYRAGNWDTAIASFQKALSLNPKDKLTGTYIERCELMKAHPPEGEWDGVWVMTDK